MLTDKRIAVLGVGKIGEALIGGLLADGIVTTGQIVGTVKREASLERVRQRFGIAVGRDNREAVQGAHIVICALKPQGMVGVLQELREQLPPGALLISVAASVTTGLMERTLGGEPAVVRVMPNTPCVIRDGMSVLARGAHATDEHLALAEEIFKSVGRTVVLDENLMDAATGLSGSGPAYMYMVVEALSEAGVKVGIPRDVSTLLSAQTMLGAARLVLERGAHPALLRDEVTTPAGCTVDGLMALEDGGLRVTFIKAVVEATRRARELVDG